MASILSGCLLVPSLWQSLLDATFYPSYPRLGWYRPDPTCGALCRDRSVACSFTETIEEELIGSVGFQA